MARPAETRQIPLDLAPEPSFEREAFLVTGCNRQAFERVLGDSWRGQALILSGPEASGKTHLAHIWAADERAAILPADDLAVADIAAIAEGPVCIDNADRVAGLPAAERALFHLRNAMYQQRRSLLLTARCEPGRWNLALPDLASRIAAALHVRLAPPDDALLAAVLVKLFDDRQVLVPPRLVNWLVPRMDRSLATARELVARLDSAALAKGGPVTQKMAEAVLDKL